MRKLTCLIIALSVGVYSCTSKEEGIRIEVTNTMDQSRDDAIILLSKGSIYDWTKIPEGQWPGPKDEAGAYIPTQLDDLDGDGQWDGLFALTHMDASSQKMVSLVFVLPDEFPVFETRTNLRLGSNEKGYPELLEASRLEGITYHNHSRTGEVYQMEGPAWENDKVGFRNYLDQRNGMDIFGKLIPEMVLDSVGIERKAKLS